jgi:hypothetical protein
MSSKKLLLAVLLLPLHVGVSIERLQRVKFLITA